jgi:DNA adenine methylase
MQTWKAGDRALFKGERCQIDKLGTAGAYKNKAKIITNDFEEKWVYLTQLESVTSPKPAAIAEMNGFKIGDRIVEDGNNPEWGVKIDCLIKRAEIVEFRPSYPGSDAIFPWVLDDNGTEGFAIWEFLSHDTDGKPPVTPRVGDARKESEEAFKEVIEALSNPITQPQWERDDEVCTLSGLTGRITNIDMTRHVPYCVQWHNGAASWYDAETASKWTKTECSSLMNSSEVSADSVKQPSSSEVSPSETTLISMPTPKQSINTITQALTSTVISKPIIPAQEPIFTPLDFPARAHHALAIEPGLVTPNPAYGLKPCDASSKAIQTLWLLKTLKTLSIQGFEQCLEDSEWQNIRGTIRSCYQQHGSALRTGAIGSLLLPTPTSYSEGSGSVRPAGQNKLETTLKLLPTPTAADASTGELLTSKMQFRITKNGVPRKISNNGIDGSIGLGRLLMLTPKPEEPFIKQGDKLNPPVPGWMMGFQHGYVEKVLMDGGETIHHPFIQAFPPKLQVGELVSNSTGELLSHNRQRSHSVESSISTPCCKPPTEPFLKWAGGKSWAVELVKEIYTPFRDYRLISLTLGGGAIELGLQPERSLLCDINPYLINLWQWVKENGKFTIPLESCEEYFHEIRDRFNKNPLHPDAPQWFYLLNHTCFNGLQRGSSKKHFNVGFGKYKKFHGQTDLIHYKAVMSQWEFKAQSWEQTLLDIQEDDFLIFDPPYHGTGFKEYYGKFTDDDQMFAAAGLARLVNPIVAFNAATPEMLELYQELGFDIQVKEVARSISCDGNRTPALEMVATKNLKRFKSAHLSDKSPTPRPKTRSKNKTQASGSLSKVGGKKLKDGSRTERWLYSYSEKVGDGWRTVKRHVPNEKVDMVKEAIANKLGYEHICQSILK